MPGERISVVMPVRNALPYLDEAVASILAQTHGDFEFVIRDDGSTDGSLERLREWRDRDPRIRLFEGETSLGPAGSSNWVVRQASCRLIARMDADDVSRPERLAHQLEVFRAQPDAVLVGTLAEGIDRRGRVVRARDLAAIVRRSAFVPFNHGTIMFRRDAFERVGGYRAQCNLWEDVDFCLRLSAEGQVFVLAEALYLFRFNTNSVRLTEPDERVERAVDTAYRCIDEYRSGGDYEGMLAGEVARSGDRKVKPQAALALASLRLWSGGSPAVLSTLLRRTDLGWDRVSGAALAWAIWGGFSATSLRFVLRHTQRLRNLWAGRNIASGDVCEWRPS